MKVIQYSMYDNSIIAVFDDYRQAAERLRIRPNVVYQHVKCRRGIKHPQREFYLRYETDKPEQHRIFECYDEDKKLLYTGFSIKDVAEKCGMDYGSVLGQLRRNKGVSLNNRHTGFSGLIFMEKEVL